MVMIYPVDMSVSKELPEDRNMLSSFVEPRGRQNVW